MAKDATCAVDGCEKRPHAKGYCRKHYGQIWRKGEIRTDEEERQAAEKPVTQNDADRIRALERELRRAEMMYRNVVGVEGRIKWRRELEGLRKDMIRLGVAPAVPAAEEVAP